MLNDEENVPHGQIEALRIARNDKFCTALPFPPFDWTDETTIENSLAELRDYAEQLANSALDWYLQKKTTKKRFAQFFHYSTYAVGIAAAIIPLLKFGAFLDITVVKQYLGQDAGSLAAETSLALIGFAGVLTFIDRTAGYTADWMRYITTASRINKALIEFQFDWNKLDCDSPYRPGPENSGEAKNSSRTARLSPVTQRVDLAKSFCLKILEFMDQETSIWTDELKQRVAQMAGSLPQPKTR